MGGAERLGHTQPIHGLQAALWLFVPRTEYLAH